MKKFIQLSICLLMVLFMGYEAFYANIPILNQMACIIFGAMILVLGLTFIFDKLFERKTPMIDPMLDS